MGVAPPPQVPSGVLQRVRADMRSQRAARGAILRRFSLELTEPTRRMSIRQMPTLSPRGGLPVVVRARE